MTTLTKKQLGILQHALGLDQYGQGKPYRNFFCAGEDDEAACKALVEAGLMKQHQRTELYPYFNCSVTDAGKLAVREQSPKPPKLTRSQQRYQHYLDWADAHDGTFKEYLAEMKRRKEAA